MAMWSDVELLTNEDTNTVRFGNVSREESDSGLYQVDTLVKISTANEVINVSIYSNVTLTRKCFCFPVTQLVTNMHRLIKKKVSFGYMLPLVLLQ